MCNEENLNNEDEKKKDDMAVIEGDGKELNISPVYNHIKLDKTNNDKGKKIIIPKEKK